MMTAPPAPARDAVCYGWCGEASRALLLALPKVNVQHSKDWGGAEPLSAYVRAEPEHRGRRRGHSMIRCRTRAGSVDLRWILIHMIEETARHNGHADIIRELIDGATGD